MAAAHLPVMVEPVLRILNPRPGECILNFLYQCYSICQYRTRSSTY